MFRFLLLSWALSLLGLVILEMLLASFRGIINFMPSVHQTGNFIHPFLSPEFRELTSMRIEEKSSKKDV